MSKISCLIKEYRFNNEISQREFAAMCGISQNYLSQIENEKKKPGLEVYLQICAALEICPYTLIKCKKFFY